MSESRPAISFVKAHAYGNDFLLAPLSAMTGDDSWPAALARHMCDRHRGLGADGLIFYAAEGETTRMHLFNADGSRSEISGNGVRCLAARLLDQSRTAPAPGTGPERVSIATDAGLKALDLIEHRGSRWTFRTAMGAPRDLERRTLEVGGERLELVTLSVGNPQCVLLEALDDDRLHRLGPLLERHPAFPDRTNVSFVEVETPSRLRILIWERGVGPTEASGTGACGAAAAAIAHAGAERDLQVSSPGGTQRVEWTDEGLFLTGWAEILAEGRWVAEAAPPAGESAPHS